MDLTITWFMARGGGPKPQAPPSPFHLALATPFFFSVWFGSPPPYVCSTCLRYKFLCGDSRAGSSFAPGLSLLRVPTHPNPTGQETLLLRVAPALPRDTRPTGAISYHWARNPTSSDFNLATHVGLTRPSLLWALPHHLSTQAKQGNVFPLKLTLMRRRPHRGK